MTEIIPNVKPTVAFDFNVNKQDIIDMVLAERTEEVERQLDAAQAVFDDATKALERAREHARRGVAEIAAVELKQLYKLYGQPTKVEPCYQFKSIEVNWRDVDDEDFNSGIALRVTIAMTDAMKEKHTLLKAVVAAERDQENAEKAVGMAQRELRELTKKGVRAKAQIVRQLLESTDEGKAILAQVARSGRSLLGAGTPAKKK
jgi:hypothetical protein